MGEFRVKEVVDVTFINMNTGEVVLYLDTLKVTNTNVGGTFYEFVMGESK